MSDQRPRFGAGVLPEGWDDGMDALQRVAFLTAYSDQVARLLQRAVDAARSEGSSWRDLDGVMGLPRGASREVFERD